MVLSGCSVEGVGKAFGHFGWPGPGISLQAHKMYDLWIASVIAALIVGSLPASEGLEQGVFGAGRRGRNREGR